MTNKPKVHTEVSSARVIKQKPPDVHTVNAIQRIKFFRVVLIIALIAAGVSSAVMSHTVLRNQEEAKFKSELTSLANEIFLAVNEGFTSKIITLDHMSTMYSYQCPHAHQWPNCSVSKNYFEAFTAPLVDVSTSRSIASNPIVWPHQKESFEKFAYDLFSSEGYPTGTGTSSFGRGIFKSKSDGTRCEDITGKTNFSKYALFNPVFQPGQLANNWKGIMYNMVSEGTRMCALKSHTACSAFLGS